MKAFFVLINILIAILCLPTFFVANGWATTEASGSLFTQVKYDTNVNFSSSNDLEDWIYELLPKFTLRNFTETSNLWVSAGFRAQKYNTEDQLDCLDQKYQLEGSYNLTERFSFGISGRYSLDTTLDQELEEGGYILTRSRRKLYRISPSIRWNSSERTSWTFSTDSYHVNYQNDYYSDYSTFYATLGCTHFLSDQTTYLIVQTSAGTIDFQEGNSRTYDINLGIGKSFTERLSGEVLLGINYTKSRQRVVVGWNEYIIWPSLEIVREPVIETKTYYDTGWIGAGKLKWLWETGGINLSATRNVSGSAYGQTTTRSRLTTIVRQNLSERLFLSTYISYSKVEFENSLYNYSDYDTFDINQGIGFRITPNTTISLYYRYSEQSYDKSSNTAVRHQVYLRLNFTELFKNAL